MGHYHTCFVCLFCAKTHATIGLVCAKTFEPADLVDAKAGLVFDELPEPWGEGVNGRGWTEGGQSGNLAIWVEVGN